MAEEKVIVRECKVAKRLWTRTKRRGEEDKDGCLIGNPGTRDIHLNYHPCAQVLFDRHHSSSLLISQLGLRYGATDRTDASQGTPQKPILSRDGEASESWRLWPGNHLSTSRSAAKPTT